MIADPSLFPPEAKAELDEFTKWSEKVGCRPGDYVKQCVSLDQATGERGMLHRECPDEPGIWGPITYRVEPTNEWIEE